MRLLSINRAAALDNDFPRESPQSIPSHTYSCWCLFDNTLVRKVRLAGPPTWQKQGCPPAVRPRPQFFRNNLRNEALWAASRPECLIILAGPDPMLTFEYCIKESAKHS